MGLIKVERRLIYDAPIIDGWQQNGDLVAPMGHLEWSRCLTRAGTRVSDRDGELPDLIVPITYPDPVAFIGRTERNGLDRGVEAVWQDQSIRLLQDGAGWSRSSRAVHLQYGDKSIRATVGLPMMTLFDGAGLGRLAEQRRTTLFVHSDADRSELALVTMLLAIGIVDRVRISWGL